MKNKSHPKQKVRFLSLFGNDEAITSPIEPPLADDMAQQNMI